MPRAAWAASRRQMEPGWHCSGQGTEVTALEGLEVHPVVVVPLWGLVEARSSLFLMARVPAVGTQVQSLTVTGPVTLSRHHHVAGLSVLGGCPRRQSPGAVSFLGSTPPAQVLSVVWASPGFEFIFPCPQRNTRRGHTWRMKPSQGRAGLAFLVAETIERVTYEAA